MGMKFFSYLCQTSSPGQAWSWWSRLSSWISLVPSLRFEQVVFCCMVEALRSKVVGFYKIELGWEPQSVKSSETNLGTSSGGFVIGGLSEKMLCWKTDQHRPTSTNLRERTCRFVQVHIFFYRSLIFIRIQTMDFFLRHHSANGLNKLLPVVWNVTVLLYTTAKKRATSSAAMSLTSQLNTLKFAPSIQSCSTKSLAA